MCHFRFPLTFFLLLLLATRAIAGDGPPLPEGLAAPEKKASRNPPLPAGLGGGEKNSDGPALPMGLGGSSDSDDPALPAGLDQPATVEAKSEKQEDEAEKPPSLGSRMADRWDKIRDNLPLDVSGFAEGRVGSRLQEDKHQKEMSIGETRFHLSLLKAWDKVELKATADFLYDPVFDDAEVDLETGHGWLDLREAYVLGRPTDWMDIKAGRQVLTWGTGDLLFINDMFPKDWNSFFIGRDDEYLKAPSDAIKTSFFSDAVNVNLVYTPRFDSDRYIDGERVSYYNGQLGRASGRDAPVRADVPDEWFHDDEWALRLYKNVKGYELAAYGYDGFWKSPAGMDPATGKATFPRLSVFGASVRGVVGKGIGNAEAGYYLSRDDRSGGDPFVRNSEFRFLLGYEQDLGHEWTAGLQYYVEWMQEHDAYMRSLPPGAHASDRVRQVVTLRLTKLLMNQNLRLSCFAYWSPTDRDAYIRPKAHYRINDHWSVEAGGNLFVGKDEYTFFSQFEDATNAFAALRLSF